MVGVTKRAYCRASRFRWGVTHALALGALLSLDAPPAHANWLSELAELATKTGSKAGTAAKAGALEGLASGLTRLPADLKKVALAAEALPDGAWRFVNASGEVITATEAKDIGRVMAVLLPDLARDASLRPNLLIGADTLFEQRGGLALLPDTVTLRLVDGNNAFPIIRQGQGDALKLYAELRPELVLEATERLTFEDAVWRLARPLRPHSIRVLSLDGGATGRLPIARPLAGAGTAPRPELVAAFDLNTGLANLRGQTVILSGQIEGPMLRFADASGVEQSVPLNSVFAAAEGNGIDLILLGANSARQPGTRNWLMRETAVADLEAALAGKTLGDLHAALGRGQGRLNVTAVPGRGGYTRLSTRPAESELPPPSGVFEAPGVGGHVLVATLRLLSGPLGDVQAQSIETSAPSREQQSEQDSRLVWFIPSVVQNLYLGGAIAGLLAWPMVARWFNGLWVRTMPAGVARSWAGWLAMRIVHVFVAVPVLGIPALLMTAGMLQNRFSSLLWPWRARQP